MLEELKERVCRLNRQLAAERLVVMTSGNVSGRDTEGSRVVIKPSGVAFDQLAPAAMVVVSLEGDVIEGRLRPSVDTATHLYIYRHRRDVHGIAHTHSNYATAFAAANRPIPAMLTAVADEFGGPVHVAPYAPVGGEDIGKAVVEHIGDAKAILLKHHGVFTIGESPEAAFKSAVMLEDVAKTCFLALRLGASEELPPEELARAHRRYREKYGQRQ